LYDFNYNEYIDNSTSIVDILAFEETKPSNEAANEDMDIDDEEKKTEEIERQQ